MRYSIIAKDKTVYIDGAPFHDIKMENLPENLHAVQWYGTWGEEEYIDPITLKHNNIKINSFEKYQEIINACNKQQANNDSLPNEGFGDTAE